MDQIEKYAISDLKEAAQNSRKHTEAQIDQIAVSIERFGWTIPVVIDEKCTIIAGHARIRAAKKLGMKEAPCLVASDWSEEKKEAYQIADNRLSELSEWDNDILSDQMKRLNAIHFDMSFLDMSDFETELFNPVLDPKIDTGDVTKAQVEKTQAGLEGRFDGEQSKGGKAYDITCPHCGEDFEVQI